MSEFLINDIEIPYLIMGGYARISDMFDEYRRLYGQNRRNDLDREDEMLVLFGFIMSARHSNTNLTQDVTYQNLITNFYSQYSLDKYTPPIINGI